MITIKKIDYNYSDGKATCTIITNDNNKVFIGTAICHEDDFDMESKKTGCMIAESRAYISLLKSVKKDLKIELKGMKQLYYSMKHSSKFNPKSYENIMLQRRIRFLENDLATVNNEISEGFKNLNNFILDKEMFYKKIRSKRALKAEIEQN